MLVSWALGDLALSTRVDLPKCCFNTGKFLIRIKVNWWPNSPFFLNPCTVRSKLLLNLDHKPIIYQSWLTTNRKFWLSRQNSHNDWKRRRSGNNSTGRPAIVRREWIGSHFYDSVSKLVFSLLNSSNTHWLNNFRLTKIFFALFQCRLHRNL